MSTNDLGVFWMSLAHPQGRLILTKDYTPGFAEAEPMNHYKAYFHGVSRETLVEITARGLAAEKRFSHQLRRPVSVLEHSYWLHLFLQKRVPDAADYGLLHDTPEAFGHDRPKMMKTEEDCAIEDAVYEAFQWRVPILDPDNQPSSQIEVAQQFKQWDGISAAAEATLFGFAWPWIGDYRKRFGDANVDDYIMHVAKWENTPLDEVREKWLQAVYEVMGRKGLRPDDSFAVGADLLSRITHK